MMLGGALAGAAGAAYFSSPWAGVAIALLAGAMMGLLFAFLTVTSLADQVVVGTALNLAASGATTVLGRGALGASTELARVHAFAGAPIPLLSSIPVLGPALFTQTPMVYLAIVLVPVCAFVLWHTSFGLTLRATGEHPLAVEAAGLDVIRTRYACAVLDGMLASLAGAFLSLSVIGMFTNDMVAGRGFIAIAAVVFGRWTITGALAASLLFGAADAFQVRLQVAGVHVPYQFLLMVPYILTLITYAGFVGRAEQPAATGVPYRRA
jgi:ABC-type uncharacterized transport system permease subunit